MRQTRCAERLPSIHLLPCPFFFFSGPLPLLRFYLAHRATDVDEKARIRSKGGKVVQGRVMGVLEPSRVIGVSEFVVVSGLLRSCFVPVRLVQLSFNHQRRCLPIRYVAASFSHSEVRKGTVAGSASVVTRLPP